MSTSTDSPPVRRRRDRRLLPPLVFLLVLALAALGVWWKVFQDAGARAEAAEAAGAQGRFWEMHDRLFAGQDRLMPGDLIEHAAAAGLDGWRLLPERRQLLRPDGRECPLTTAEFDLVRVLVERPGRAVSRDAIARSVFGRPFRPEDRTVDNLVLRLRRKLDAAGPRAIRTVRGAGYMFAGFGRGGGDRAAGREGGRAA